MQARQSSRARAVYIWLMAPILGFAVFLAVFASVASPVQAATSSNLNFQARLLTNTGGIVPDGNYNIDFKIYNADSVTGSVGTCSGSCLWEETRKNSNSQGVQVINGYFSVNLGSVTAFGSINWDQPLWLTMNIGGTTTGASPTWDGEMQNAGHSIALTALPYAFVAAQLAKSDGSGHRGTLGFNTVANNPNILLPDASGTVCLQAASACGFESTTGTDFIQNQSAGVQTASFNISGTGQLGTAVQVPLVQTADSAAGNTATLTVRTGNETGSSLSSGNVVIKSGDAGGGTNSSSGNVSIDSGSKSGSGTTGSITIGGTNSTQVNIGNSSSKLDISGSAALKKGTDYSTTGIQSDVGLANASLVRLTGASTQTITGIANGRDGYLLTLVNAASQAAVLANNGDLGTSSAGNLIITGTGADYSVASGGSVELVYDSGSSVWRLVSATTGVTTVGTYSSSNHYANGASITGNTLTLGSADSSNPGLIDTSGQTFAGNKTFTGTLSVAPTTNISSAIIKQTSAASPSNDIFDVQGTNGTSNFIQVTSTAANQGAVTIQSFGGSNGLTLQSASGTVSLGTSTTLNASGALTLASGGSSDLTLNSLSGTLKIGSNTGGVLFTNSSSASINASSGNGLNLGTSNDGHVTTLGSTNAGATTTINGGNGIAFTGNTTVNSGKTFTVTDGAASLLDSTGTALTVNNSTGSNSIAVFQDNGTPVITFADNGATTFENSSNSTTAFQVQDNGAGDLLNVNTTDGYVINNGVQNLSQNVLQNPGFESSGAGTGTGWYTPGANQAITNDSTNAHGGNYVLEVTGDSSTHSILSKYYAVTPGDQIYLEAYVKNSAGANGDGGIFLEYFDKDKGNNTFVNNNTGLLGTSYVKKTITDTVPSGKFYVRIAASVKATATTGTFYFDDFYLKRINEQSPLTLTAVSSTAFQVQNSSGATVLGVDTSASKIFTTIGDSGTAVGFTLNTPSYTTSGAKLFSLQNNSAEKFYVDKDGNINASGTITAGGNINAGASSKFTINGTQISSADLSNNSNLAKLDSGGANPQIFTGNNKFTGTALVANTNAAGFQVQNASANVMTVDTNGNKVILGTAGGSGLTANLQFDYSGSTGSIAFVPLDPSSTNYTLNLPAENGTLCTSAASSTTNCSNFASASGLTSGLAAKLNKGTVDTSSHAVTALEGNLYVFTNTSSNIASGVLKLDNGNNTANALTVTGSANYSSGNGYIVVNNTNGTPGGALLDLQANSTSEFNVDATGNVTAAGNISIASGKQYQINGTQISSANLSNDSNLAKLTTGPQTFTNVNTFSNASNSFTGDGSGLSNLNATNVASGTLNDGRLSSNVALLNRTGQSFTGDNTFAPTGNNVGTVIKQTSGTATSGSVLDVQTANGTSHFLTITNAAANEGNVTLQSVGATRDLTLDSGSGTIKIGATATTLQKGATAFTIDLNNSSDSLLTITNSGSGVGSLSVEGDITAGTGRTFKVGATSGASTTCSSSTFLMNQVVTGGLTTGGSCANAVTGLTTPSGSNANGGSVSGNNLVLSYADTTNPGIVSTSSQNFTGAKSFQTTSSTAFQVQTSGGSSTLLTANTSNMSFSVNGAAIYTANTYSSGSTSTITQSLIDNNTAILASATASGLTFTVPSPTTTTSGRLLYVTNNGSNSFVISYGTGSFSLSVNSTVTLIWNGSNWTSAGADAGTLQTAYNNSTNSSTTAEIKVDSSRGGLDIQDADSSIGANLLNVRASNGSGLGQILFGVGNTGNVILQNSANSATAFQIQNTIGSNAVRVDTTPINTLITNGSFEGTDVSAWTAKGTAGAPSRDTSTTPYLGLASLTDAAGTASGNGIKFVTSSLTNATTYALSFSIRQISGTALSSSNFEIGWNNGTTDTACTGLNPSLTAQAPITTGWIRYSCTFTGSTSGHIYWKLSATVGSAVTFNLDAVQLEQASSSSGYKETGLIFNGLISSPVSLQNQSNSNNAFQVQNASGANILVVDSVNRQLKIYENGGSTNYALIYYDTATSTANYTASSGTVAVGTGAGAITITAGSGGAVNITGNAASTWKTNTGTLTLQSGSSSDLILNSGSSIVSINGSSVVKLGSASSDPTCTNGAIYYNTTTPQLRGCINGTWQNLASITPTLQTAYTASTASLTTPEIKVDSTRGGLNIQDADSTIGGILFSVNGTNAGGLGTSILNVNSSNSTVNIGTAATTTGILVLGSDTNATFNAGTTTSAATEIDGAMFYSSSDHNFLCGTAGQWITCNGLLYSNTAASTAVNTCTTACAAFSTNNSTTVPANYCQAGRVIRINARGHYSVAAATTPTLAMGVYYGTNSTTFGSDTQIGALTPAPASASGASNQFWAFDFTITCFDTTHMMGEGTYTFQNNTTATTSMLVLNVLSTSSTVVTTNSAKALYIFPTWSANSASNTVTLDQLAITGN